MGLSTILFISLGAGLILVAGGGVMMYMANLVKSAYEIKVQISTDVDERLTKMGDDLDKKSRWIKRDLIEEIEKIRMALTADNAKKFRELTEPLLARIDGIEQMIRADRGEWVKAVEADRNALVEADNRLKGLRRDIKRVEERLGLAPAEPSALPPSPAPEQAAESAASMPAAAASAPPPPAPPAVKKGPIAVGSILQEL